MPDACKFLQASQGTDAQVPPRYRRTQSQLLELPAFTSKDFLTFPLTGSCSSTRAANEHARFGLGGLRCGLAANSEFTQESHHRTPVRESGLKQIQANKCGE